MMMISSPARIRCAAAYAASMLLGMSLTGEALAQRATAAPATSVTAEAGTRWRDLTPSQRSALAPLERDWSTINSPHKQKWLELSTRFPSMTRDERARVQTRMADWAKLTPQERSRARVNFEQAKQVPSKDRQARWEAYQALPPEQKRELADRAAPPPPSRNAEAARQLTNAAPEQADRPLGREPTPAPGKSNIVPNPAFAAPPRPIAPSMVQAQPGATTTLISKRPAPPAHQQTGLPKIAATPEFVNKATLLPRRGPQAAAVRDAPAASAARR